MLGTIPKFHFQAHIREMAEEWNEQLRCPKCRMTGMASLSHPKGDLSPTVLTVPTGFKEIKTEYGPNFECGSCGIIVED